MLPAPGHCPGHAEAEALTSRRPCLAAPPREILFNPWRVTKILKWVLGTTVHVSGLGWDFVSLGDVLPGAGFTLLAKKTLLTRVAQWLR